MTDSPLHWLLQKPKPLLQRQPVFSLKQAGELLGLKLQQMRRHVKEGRIRAIRIGERGHFRVLQSEVEKFRENK